LCVIKVTTWADLCVIKVTTDRNQYGGGLVAYARSDLACDRKMNLEYQTIESICIEININKTEVDVFFEGF
jgi:hypothetical protein